MAHTDPDMIAMMALGETDFPASDVEHLLTCPGCAAELESLRRVARLARESGPVGLALDSPAPAVWEQIAASVALLSDEPERTSSTRPEATVGLPRTDVRLRSRRRWWVAGAAGVAALAVAASVSIIATLPRTPKPTTVATATLVALPAWAGAQGEATVERAADGHTRLVVRLEAKQPGDDAYREVWVMSASLSKLISIGVMSGSEGEFEVPSDIDLNRYPIVDISEEPVDGNPAHSGDSIVRGRLS